MNGLAPSMGEAGPIGDASVASRDGSSVLAHFRDNGPYGRRKRSM
jgi:hypothetical protein